DQAYESLSNVIEELPEGPLIVGGFSQGGAIASMMLERSIQDRIVGLVLIGTMSINPIGLKSAISNTWQRHVVWMHGENDKKIPISIGKEHIRIFDDAGWNVIKLEHK
ncbi:MAG: alpha/beta hydrolase, partial [Candidatus Poseidoniales archaeon]